MSDTIPDTCQVINHAYLSSIADGDEEFERELVGAFLDTCGDTLDALRNAVQGHDAKAVRDRSHALKGSARAIGAERVGEACDQLEVCARAATLDRATSIFELVERELTALQNALAPYSSV